MQRHDLMRHLADRAGALFEIGAGVRRFAGDGKAHEDAGFAAGDDGVAGPARLGVEHQRARRASASIIAREDGEPISSSAVNRTTTGAGAAENLLSAAATKQFMTRPAFMSAARMASHRTFSLGMTSSPTPCRSRNCADRLPCLINSGLVVGVTVDVAELRQPRLRRLFLCRASRGPASAAESSAVMRRNPVFVRLRARRLPWS